MGVRLVRSVLVAIAAMCSGQALAGEIPTTFQRSVRLGDDLVVVRLASSPFSANADGIDTSTLWTFDGRRVIGGFPDLPSDRLSMFEVVWSGQAFSVAQALYEDLFTPFLREREARWDQDGGVLVIPAESGDSILVNMKASRAACCSYEVWWVVRKSGEITRFVDESIP